MSSTDIDTVIEITLAATGKYADKAQALQKELSAAAREDDYVLLSTVIEQYIQEVEKLHANLKGILAKVIELGSNKARQEPYSERWWQQKRRELYKVFEMDPQNGLSQWLRVCAGALIDWELGVCEKLVKESFPFPSKEFDVSNLFRNGTKAIIDEKYPQALDMLTYLVQAASEKLSHPILNEFTRATLLVFVGRIYLYKVFDVEVALSYFEQAKELASKDGRPYSALGEYYRLNSDRDKASAFYQQAIELSPKQPDGYIGMGLLMEDQSLWDEADDRYEEAIEAVREEKDIQVALSKLLAPVSGNVYLQIARMLKKKDPDQALRSVEHAITTGIKHDGNYPERLGYKLKGELLESLERRVEAAAAYYEAGQRFSWRDEYKISIDLLTHANELDSKNISIYWNLSDSLRLSSYKTTFPFADEDLIKKSRDAWERGYAKAKSADTDYAFGYVVRALINEPLARITGANRWALWWEAITYSERALLVNDTIARYWGFLSGLYRSVEAELTTLSTTAKALELDPRDPIALEERSYILANTGQFELAGDVIDTRFKLQPSPDLKALKAFVFFYRKAYREALQFLDEYFTELPEEKSYRDLRAYCYQMLDEWSGAKQEFEWILNNCKETDFDQRSKVAWATYNLNDLDRAIEIYKKLCNEPTEEGNAYRGLGLCYLARGDLALGKQSLDRGIELALNPRELYDLLDLDLYNLERSSPIWAEGARQKTLDEIKQKISDKRTQLEQRRSTVEEELKKVIENNPPEEGEVNWPRIAAQSGLARFYREQQRWSEAATAYLLLQNEGERFPEALNGLEKSFDGLQAEGDACLKEGKPTEALEQLLQISKLELLSDDKTRQAQLYSRLGYVYFDLTDIVNARKHFAKALQLYHENGSSSPGSALSEICQALLRNATQYWALNAEWKAMAEEQGTDEILRSELIIARKSLANYLDEFYKLSEQHVDRTELLPVVTPIVLEIGDGLIPADTSQEWSLFKF